MKKLIATFCLVLGFVTVSFASIPVAAYAPSSPDVSSVQEKREKPDAIIVITDDKGVIIDIIVIKQQ